MVMKAFLALETLEEKDAIRENDSTEFVEE